MVLGIHRPESPSGLLLDAQPAPSDAVNVGKVADAWGVQGAVKIYPYSNDPQALLASRKWYLSPSSGQPSGFRTQGFVKVKEVKRHGTYLVARFDGVTDRNLAEMFRGAEISVPRSSFPTSGPDEFYWVDLMGLSVVNLEGVDLGQVYDLISNGPQTVLAIRALQIDGSFVERLIPFVSHYVAEVHKAKGQIRVDWQPDY